MFYQGVLSILAGVLLLAPSAALAAAPDAHRLATSLQSPGPRQVPPGPSRALAATEPQEVMENIGAAKRYFVGIMTKLGYHCRPVLSACQTAPRLDNHPEIASAQAPEVVAGQALAELQKYTREQLWEARAQPNAPLANAGGYSFPVAGPSSFRDTWGDPRPGGRCHRAVDIFALEGTAVYAVTAGTIHTLATYPEAGITLLMQGRDGRGYGYMHLQGYAPGIVEGKMVRSGELLGYVGRTGVKQSAAHLHFQVYADQRLCKEELLNPYPFLVQLSHGVGVTDLSQPQIVRAKYLETKPGRIRVYRLTSQIDFSKNGWRRRSQEPLLVIKNY